MRRPELTVVSLILGILTTLSAAADKERPCRGKQEIIKLKFRLSTWIWAVKPGCSHETDYLAVPDWRGQHMYRYAWIFLNFCMLLTPVPCTTRCLASSTGGHHLPALHAPRLIWKRVIPGQVSIKLGPGRTDHAVVYASAIDTYTFTVQRRLPTSVRIWPLPKAKEPITAQGFASLRSLQPVTLNHRIRLSRIDQMEGGFARLRRLK